jgi:IS30 family transposase
LRQRQRPLRISSKAAYKGSIPHRISIDDRPTTVDEKTRIGDWEVDLMMGGHGGGGLLTLVDRKTRFTRMEPVLSKHADHVADVLIGGALSEIKGQVHTLTMDNGNEFSQHERAAKALQAKVYFAHPYFPKGTHFKTITQAEIRRAENRLNGRPRKALEFRSPHALATLARVEQPPETS